MKLIVNADDFGYSIGHNHGIIHAHTHGIVKSTSLMANGEEVLHAINLLRQHTSLDVGIHVVLDYKRPISNPTLIPTLLDQNQNFKKSFNKIVTPQFVFLQLVPQKCLKHLDQIELQIA